MRTFDVKSLVCRGKNPGTLHRAPVGQGCRPGALGSWLACHCLWVLVWTGACYLHGVGGFVFNSPSSPEAKVPCPGVSSIQQRAVARVDHRQ